MGEAPPFSTQAPGHAGSAILALEAPVAVTLGRWMVHIPPQSPMGRTSRGWDPGTGSRFRELAAGTGFLF